MCKGVAVKERGGWLSGKRGWKTSGSRPVSVKMQLRFCMTCSYSKKTRREATRKKKKRGKNRKKEIEKTREKKTVNGSHKYRSAIFPSNLLPFPPFPSLTPISLLAYLFSIRLVSYRSTKSMESRFLSTVVVVVVVQLPRIVRRR